MFYDRVQEAVRPAIIPYLLAHVLVHEIAHMLQGTGHHEDNGVMKRRWNTSDYTQMDWQPLAFSEFDITLIHQRIDTRASRLAAQTPVSAWVAVL